MNQSVFNQVRENKNKRRVICTKVGIKEKIRQRIQDMEEIGIIDIEKGRTLSRNVKGGHYSLK